MGWAKTRPEAFSEKTGKPDVRGAYGLAREVIALLKHLQHAPGKTVIFVGILERVVDEFNASTGSRRWKAARRRELPGSSTRSSMSLFEPDGDGWRHEPAKGQAAASSAVRQSLRPARQGPLRQARRDRAARPRRAAHQDQPGRPNGLSFSTSTEIIEHVRLQRRRAAAADLIPDGTFAKVAMTIRPGGVDGQTEIDQGCSRLEHAGQRRAEPRLRIHGDRGPPRPSQVLAFVHGLGRRRREGRFDRLEHLQAHLPRHDRQRARPRSRRQQRGRQGEARLRGLADLDGITFVAKIAVEPNNDPATRTRTSSTGRCCPTRKSGARS